MNKQITFTDLTGQSKTVDPSKAAQLAAYIAKQICICQDSIRASEVLKDMGSKAKYEAQIAAMATVAAQINAQLG